MKYKCYVLKRNRWKLGMLYILIAKKEKGVRA